MTDKFRVAVLGGGSFGTAISNIMADNGHDIRLWMRSDERAAEVNEQHINSAYLPDTPLNPALRATTDLVEAVSDRDIVYVAVPSKSSRQVAQQLKTCLPEGCMLISTTKGIEAEGFTLMSQVLAQELPQARIGVLSGPNLAKEIAARHITGTVIASEDEDLVETVQAMLQCSYFRVYGSNDTYGVELGGALKNIYAICCGMAEAIGAGPNTMGILLTRSLAEMSRFAVHKGANPLTFLGLSGVGDLFVTCTSPLSRNFRVGLALGQGQDLDQVVAELGQVAEGVNTLRLVKDEADAQDIYMPLVQGLYAIIYQGKTLDEVVATMMFAEQPQDVEFMLAEDDS